MLDRNINSIIYQSYIKLGDIAYNISVNSKAGLEDTKEQRHLWSQAIAIYSYLDVIANHTEVVNNQVYRIINIEVAEMNKLLSCLKEIAKIYDYPVAPFIPAIYPSQIAIGAGLPGNPGADGQSAYFYIAFAEDNIGTGFSATPNITRPYVAFRTSTTPLAFDPTTFAGLWINYFGANGSNGANGTNGTDGNTILSGIVNPTSEGVDGDYYINTASWTIFGPKAAGVWPTGTPLIGADGADGADGVDGKTILSGSGSPDNGIGVNGDYYIDTTSFYIFGPKDNDQWPIGVSIIGPTGANGADGTNGIDGTSAILYMAWADDSSGTGFTLTFNQNKDYIAFLVDVPGLTKIQSDFNGLWKKYGGEGNKWATTSVTSVTIGTGIKNFVVGLNLSYSTGQRVVIALDNDEDNRMEGYVRSYDPTTGQLSVDVESIFGSGTYAVWDVNLLGVPVQVITTDSYYGEIYIDDNTAGTPEALSTAYAKIAQFDTNGDFSPGIVVDHTTDDIEVTVRGAYHIYFDASVSCDTAGAEIIFQLFKDGVAVDGAFSRIIFENNTDLMHVAIKTTRALSASEVIDVRAKAASGTPSILIEEGRLGLFTTGSPGTPNFTKFENTDVDTGTENVDTFDATLAVGVEWDLVIRKGTNRKRVKVGATWEGTNVAWDQFNTVELGTIDVTLDVDINSGNVRLRAIATTDDWIVSGNRTLIE